MENKKSDIIISTDTDTELRFFRLAGMKGVTANEYFALMVNFMEDFTDLMEKKDLPFYTSDVSDGTSVMELDIPDDLALRFCRLAHHEDIKASEMLSEMLNTLKNKKGE